jgi:D-amino peptidase
MASGDQTACQQMSDLLGEIGTAVVKQASGRYAAECLAPQVSQGLIYEAALRAVQRLSEGDMPDPFILDTPIRVMVEFFSSDMADRASVLPYTQREDRCISFTAQEMTTAYNAFRSMVTMAAG